MIVNKPKLDFMTRHIRFLIVIMSSMDNNKINISLFLGFSQKCANIRDSKHDQNKFSSNLKRFSIKRDHELDATFIYFIFEKLLAFTFTYVT